MTRSGPAIQSVSHPGGVELPRPSGEDRGVICPMGKSGLPQAASKEYADADMSVICPMGKSGLPLLGSGRRRRDRFFRTARLEVDEPAVGPCRESATGLVWAELPELRKTVVVRRAEPAAKQPSDETHPEAAQTNRRGHPAADGKAAVWSPRLPSRPSRVSACRTRWSGPVGQAARAQSGAGIWPGRWTVGNCRGFVSIQGGGSLRAGECAACGTWAIQTSAYCRCLGRPDLRRQAPDRLALAQECGLCS